MRPFGRRDSSHPSSAGVRVALVVVVLVSLAAVGLRAQSRDDQVAAAPAGRFTGEIDVDVVTVDVVVTDRKGRPVPGLGRDDFTVYEDGQEMEITNFLAAESTAPTEPATRAAGAGEEGQERQPPVATAEPVKVTFKDRPVHVVLYLDMVFLRSGSMRGLVDELEELVRHGIPEGASVMLALFDGGIQVLVPFTTDVEEVARALEGTTTRAGHADLVASQELGILRRWSTAADPGTGGTDQISADEVAAWQEQDMDSAAADVEVLTRRSFRGLQAMVDSLAAVPGRKVLVHVSDGIPLRPDYWSGAPGKTRGNLRGVPKLLDRSPDITEVPRELKEVIAHANSLGVTIHSVYGEGGSQGLYASSGVAGPDVPGWVAYGRTDQLRERDFNRDVNLTSTLQIMASSTGGVTILKPTGEALAGLGRDLEAAYSLGYRPPHPADGQPHAIRVEVHRKGVTVRHRTGYIALGPRQRFATQALAALMMDAPDNPLGVSFKVAGDSRRQGEAFVVPLHIQVAAGALGIVPSARGWHGSLRLFLSAMDARGRLAPLVEQEIPIDIAELPAADTLFTIPATIPLEPGTHRVAVTLEDEVAGQASTASDDLVVDEQGGLWRMEEE